MSDVRIDDLRGEVLGVLGGLGPLASAEFLNTIYRYADWAQEQEAPRVVMCSDPAFPDRTTAFLVGDDDTVLHPLVDMLRRLVELGATRLLICCTTAHHLLPRVPAELRRRVVSVPRVIIGQLQASHGRYLLLCTSGTRAFRILEREPLWNAVRSKVIYPGDADQAIVHRDLIYQLKRKADPAALVPLVQSLVEKYGTDGFIVGCSEVHILANHLSSADPYGPLECIDPFLAIAFSLGQGRNTSAAGRARVDQTPVGRLGARW